MADNDGGDGAFFETWAERAIEGLDVADAMTWTRIQQGQWPQGPAGKAQAAKATSAMKHFDAARKEIMEVMEIQRLVVQGGAAAPARIVTGGSGGSNESRLKPRGHAHVWKPRGQDKLCDVPGCGVLWTKGDEEPGE